MSNSKALAEEMNEFADDIKFLLRKDKAKDEIKRLRRDGLIEERDQARLIYKLARLKSNKPKAYGGLNLIEDFIDQTRWCKKANKGLRA